MVVGIFLWNVDEDEYEQKADARWDHARQLQKEQLAGAMMAVLTGTDYIPWLKTQQQDRPLYVDGIHQTVDVMKGSSRGQICEITTIGAQQLCLPL